MDIINNTERFGSPSEIFRICQLSVLVSDSFVPNWRHAEWLKEPAGKITSSEPPPCPNQCQELKDGRMSELTFFIKFHWFLEASLFWKWIAWKAGIAVIG